MKVRVAYTVEVNDYFRRQINAYYGKPGLATRAEVVQWCKSYGDSMDDDIGAGFEDRVWDPDSERWVEDL